MYLQKNIRYLRKRRGLTQKQLAEVLGVGSTVITGYEGGRINPPLEKLLILSDYFSLTIDELVAIDLSVYQVETESDIANDPKHGYGHGLEDPVVQNLISQQQQQIMSLVKVVEDILKDQPHLDAAAKEDIQQLLLRYPEFKKYFDGFNQD